jgi:O-antigen ligase
MKKVFNLENLIYLTIFALPAYLLRFKFSVGMVGIPTNTLDGLIVACVAGGVIFHSREIGYMAFFKKHKPIIFSVGLILFGTVTSVLINKNYAVGFGIIKSWFLLPILFALVVGLVIGEKKVKNVLVVYFLSAFSVALVSLVSYSFGGATYDGRLQGIFNSPNYLAMYLAPAIFIGQGLFLEVGRKKRVLLLLLSFIILFALYLTYSYACWLSIVGAFFLAWFLEKKLSWKKGLALLALMGILFFLQTDKSKLLDLVTRSSRSSFSSRIMIWQSAEKVLENSWVWGIGAGNFQEKYLEYQKHFSPYLEWAVPHPHNLYLALWLYGGIFGLVGFLALVFFWFSALFRSQKNPSLRFIGLGIMLYILLHGLVDTTYLKNDLAVLFWLLFALL